MIVFFMLIVANSAKLHYYQSRRFVGVIGREWFPSLMYMTEIVVEEVSIVKEAH